MQNFLRFGGVCEGAQPLVLDLEQSGLHGFVKDSVPVYTGLLGACQDFLQLLAGETLTLVLNDCDDFNDSILYVHDVRRMGL